MKALFIIAFRDFQDIEFLKTKEVLEKAEIEIDVASTQKGLAKGTFGATYKVSYLLDEVYQKLDEYDAVVFIGGAGTPSVRSKSRSVDIAKKAFELNKLVCAICWAPTILAKAGILKNKQATVWLGLDSEYAKATNEVLEQYGADFVNEDVVIDKNIITANGAQSAEQFGNAIVKYLNK